MPTLGDWILARIAEDESASACEGSGEYSSCDRWSDQHFQQCSVYRKIVEIHAPLPFDDEYCSSCGDVPQALYPCETILALASIWGFRADYKDAITP